MSQTLNGRAIVTVFDKTADYTILTSENGCCFTNDGASGAVVLTLPVGEEGLHYYFNVRAAQELRIDPNGSETSSLPSTGVPGGAGKYLTANAIGESVHLMFVDGNWCVFGYTGTWEHQS